MKIVQTHKTSFFIGSDENDLKKVLYNTFSLSVSLQAKINYLTYLIAILIIFGF